MKNITLQVLTAPGCTHCHEFLEFWKGEAAKWPNVTMTELSLITPQGQEMVGKYQIFASPGIILNDELFATGGFSKEKFLAKITELSAEGEAAPSTN
jgi:glutaredoxin